MPQWGWSFEKLQFFAGKNRSFSFIKWKPLIVETRFLSHFLGNFVDLNVYLDHFFVKTLRFIDIQHFPWHFWGFGSYLSTLIKWAKIVYKYLFHVPILKTALPILMKQTLLTSFEDEKAIGPGLDLYKIHLNWSFLN